MDWPADRYHKNVISTWSAESVGVTVATITGLPANTVTWGTANLARYVPFSLGGNYLVRKVWWVNGSAVAGNIDCGVYSGDGTLLFSAGSTAQATISSVQSVDITDYLLTPGSYYFALAASSASAQIFVASYASTNAKLAGVAQQATAFPLPATATFATSSVNSLQMFGITSGTVL